MLAVYIFMSFISLLGAAIGGVCIIRKFECAFPLISISLLIMIISVVGIHDVSIGYPANIGHMDKDTFYPIVQEVELQPNKYLLVILENETQYRFFLVNESFEGKYDYLIKDSLSKLKGIEPIKKTK